MANMKSWLEKIKNRILKKDLDENLLKSKIQSEKHEKDVREKVKEKELPDLIAPTNEEINAETHEIQREEAKRMMPRNDKEEKVNKKIVHFTDVPEWTSVPRWSK